MERQLEAEDEDSHDREEESTEAETTSAPNTFGSYPLDTSGGIKIAAEEQNGDAFGGGNNNNTADFDWKAIVEEQKKTINMLQRRVQELEKELEAAKRKK